MMLLCIKTHQLQLLSKLEFPNSLIYSVHSSQFHCSWPNKISHACPYIGATTHHFLHLFHSFLQPNPALVTKCHHCHNTFYINFGNNLPFTTQIFQTKSTVIFKHVSIVTVSTKHQEMISVSFNWCECEASNVMFI